jgi:hypothetical protein
VNLKIEIKIELLNMTSFSQEQRSSLDGFKIVFKATFLFALVFFVIAGVFRMMECMFGECAYGNGERPVRTSKGYGTRSVRSRLVRGVKDQRKLEAKLRQQRDDQLELEKKKTK